MSIAYEPGDRIAVWEWASHHKGLVSIVEAEPTTGTHVTAAVSEEDMLALFADIDRQVAPVIRAIKEAETKLRAELPPLDTPSRKA